MVCEIKTGPVKPTRDTVHYFGLLDVVPAYRHMSHCGTKSFDNK